MSVFEEPAKAEMRGRCQVAIDQAGHQGVDRLVGIDLPADAPFQGRIKGDLQSVDGEGSRYCYYLRPNAGESLPEWLANFAAAAHAVPDVKLYVVADVVVPAFERACRVAGAGLLVINEDLEFEMLLNFDATLPEALDAALNDAIAQARRSLEAKTDLNLSDLQARFERIGELTRGMDQQTADRYVDNVENQYKVWSGWGDEMSMRLDAALANRDIAQVKAIEEEIERGPSELQDE